MLFEATTYSVDGRVDLAAPGIERLLPADLRVRNEQPQPTEAHIHDSAELTQVSEVGTKSLTVSLKEAGTSEWHPNLIYGAEKQRSREGDVAETPSSVLTAVLGARLICARPAGGAEQYPRPIENQDGGICSLPVETTPPRNNMVMFSCCCAIRTRTWLLFSPSSCPGRIIVVGIILCRSYMDTETRCCSVQTTGCGSRRSKMITLTLVTSRSWPTRWSSSPASAFTKGWGMRDKG